MAVASLQWMGVSCVLGLMMTMTMPATAQDSYPGSAQVRMIVPFAPGSATDITGRLIAQKLSSQMNGKFFVENKEGAGGHLGAEIVAKAAPNGYTLLLNSSSAVYGPALGMKLEYDVLKDLVPVSLVASVPFALIVHPSIASSTVTEFIAYVKANRGKLAYASGGTGAADHLGPLLFLQANGLDALHVPYKGGAPALNDTVAGRAQFSMKPTATVVPFARDGRIKVLATTGLKRSPIMPDMPTLAESGMPGFEINSWYGMMVPAKTSSVIVRRLSSEIAKALQDSEIKSQLVQLDVVAIGSSPEEYGAYLKTELERWTKVVKSAGVKLE